MYYCQRRLLWITNLRILVEMNVQDIKLEGMRILEGTHDLLEEVKYAIEQKLNLSDYSDMVRPVVLNFTTVMRI